MTTDPLDDDGVETVEGLPGESVSTEFDDLLATALYDYEEHFGQSSYEPEGGFHPSTRQKHAAILRMAISENTPHTPESLCRSLGHPYP